MLALGIRTAHAAATLVSTTPTRYAALIHPPRTIRLTFSEGIVRKSSTVKLTNLAGRAVRVTPVRTRDGSTLEVRIDSRLVPGVYMVHYTSVSSVDGSKVSGVYQFTIQ